MRKFLNVMWFIVGLLTILNVANCGAQNNVHGKGIFSYNTDSLSVQTTLTGLRLAYDSAAGLYYNEQASPAKWRIWYQAPGDTMARWHDLMSSSGGGSNLYFKNGLTKRADSSTVVLGGDLIENTFIDGLFNLRFGDNTRLYNLSGAVDNEVTFVNDGNLGGGEYVQNNNLIGITHYSENDNKSATTNWEQSLGITNYIRGGLFKINTRQNVIPTAWIERFSLDSIGNISMNTRDFLLYSEGASNYGQITTTNSNSYTTIQAGNLDGTRFSDMTTKPQEFEINAVGGIVQVNTDVFGGSGVERLKIDSVGIWAVSGDTPTPGQVITSVSGGAPSWEDPAETSPAGSNTQIQFNNSGDFGASSGLTYVDADKSVQIGTSASIGRLVIGSDIGNSWTDSQITLKDVDASTTGSISTLTTSGTSEFGYESTQLSSSTGVYIKSGTFTNSSTPGINILGGNSVSTDATPIAGSSVNITAGTVTGATSANGTGGAINLTVQTPSGGTSGTITLTGPIALTGATTVTGSLTTTSTISVNKSINTTAGDAATINSVAGRFRKDTSGAAFTLTNSFITANSIILLTEANATNDGTAVEWSVSAGSGTATITFNTAPAVNFDMNFLVIN